MKDHTTANVLLLALVFCLINSVWSIAEVSMYGAAQPSDPDTLAAILFTLAIIAAYYRGLRHGKEE